MTAVESTAIKPIRVAVVDDHRLVLDGLSARLALESPAVEVVNRSANWRDLMHDPGFPVDVVVLDLHLADGIPIATKVRALSAVGTSVVVISRHTDSASVNSALQAGAHGFVAKSDSADDLVAAIFAAARDEQFLSGPVAAQLADFSAIPDAGLGAQERRALVLYASGRTIREVSEAMGTTTETVKSYIKRGRRKYLYVGIDIGTRTLLRQHAAREGWLPPD